jgi:SAM-dependent methyltransferase
VQLRAEFIDLLRREVRAGVVDIGAGPGLDGAAFVAAGHAFVGLDLAHGNCRLAADAGVRIVQGSATAPPFKPGAFDAGWSMSTLMHLTDHDAAVAVTALAGVVTPGGPFLVGMWGGDVGDTVDASSIEGERRPFHLRTLARNTELMAGSATIEHVELWDDFPDGWQYQVFRLRA